VQYNGQGRLSMESSREAEITMFQTGYKRRARKEKSWEQLSRVGGAARKLKGDGSGSTRRSASDSLIKLRASKLSKRST